jgi:hypothetical protein
MLTFECYSVVLALLKNSKCEQFELDCVVIMRERILGKVKKREKLRE